MAGNQAIEEIKARANIVDVVKEHVPDLKKRGQNYFACCPFHSEKTPSFSVNEQMQIFKCFGCGAAGDVFTFLEKIEHLPFPEVLEKLAERTGVKLERFEVDPKLKKSQESAIAIHRIAQRLFHNLLTKHKLGNQARIYLKKRGINGEMVEKFGLGWAPGRSLVIRVLKKKGFSDQEMLEAGIAKRREARLVDAFWDRVMFPIYNEKSDLVGFMGRTLEKDRMPKYLNTSETVVFGKGRTLTGLNWAKQAIGKDEFGIVTEGTMNIIASNKVGRENIVAVLGTGFTQNHARTLHRYTKKVHFAFDNDPAGIKATLRAIPIALAHDFAIGVIRLPEGKDLDDVVQDSPQAWLSTAVNPTEAIDWIIAYWKEQIDTDTIDGKARFTYSIKPCIEALKDPIKKESWIKRLAKEINVSEKTVEASLRGQVPQKDSDDVSARAALKKDKLERYILAFLLQNWEELKAKKNRQLVKKSYLSESIYGRSLAALVDLQKSDTTEKEIQKLNQDQQLACKDVALMDLGVGEYDALETWKELVQRLRMKRAEEIVDALKVRIRDAEKSGDSKKAQSYLKKLQVLVDKNKEKVDDSEDENSD